MVWSGGHEMSVDEQDRDKDQTQAAGFGAKGSPDDGKLSENSKENLDDKLDNAMEETFPGSDPVSVKITK